MQGRALTVAFQSLDGLALIVLAAAVARPQADGLNLGLALVLAAAAWASAAGAQLFKAYRFGRREPLVLHMARALGGLAAGLAAMILAVALFAPEARLAPELGRWGLLAAPAMAALHLIWWTLVRRWRAEGRLTPNMVIVGATPAAERLIAGMLRTREANILGVFDDRLGRAPGAVHGVPVLGDTRALLDHRIMPFVDRIVITVPARARDRIRQLIEQLRVLPNEVTLLLEDAKVDLAAQVDRVADVPLAHISGPPSDFARAFNKRLQDLILASIGLILAVPVMLAVAVAIRLDSPGPVIFRQRRHGFNNEEIVVWKFRSMRHEATDHGGGRQVSANDDRVTRVGAFIRRTSLDELPQLFNVLTGQMSLVGPRPHPVGMKTGDVPSARLVAEYAHRHRMKPGVTGWAAINGSRGPVDTPEAVRRRVALDVAYIERQSFWFDLYIMMMTVPCLLGDREAVR